MPFVSSLTTKRKRSHFIIDYTLLSSPSIFCGALIQGSLTIWTEDMVRILWERLSEGGAGF